MTTEITKLFQDEIAKVRSDIELANTFEDREQAAKLVSKSMHQLNYLMSIQLGIDGDYREVTKRAVEFLNALK